MRHTDPKTIAQRARIVEAVRNGSTHAAAAAAEGATVNFATAAVQMAAPGNPNPIERPVLASDSGLLRGAFRATDPDAR